MYDFYTFYILCSLLIYIVFCNSVVSTALELLHNSWMWIKSILKEYYIATVEDLIKQNVDLSSEKDTDLGKTNTIKMSIDTDNNPPIKFEPYRTPFIKQPIVDRAVNDMLAANIICLQIILELPYSGCWQKGWH